MSFHALAISWVISLLGLSAASLVETAGKGFIAAFSALALGSVGYSLLRKKTALRPWVWNAAALAAFAFFVLDFLAISRDIITSGTRFLTVILVLKLFSLESGRDHAIIFAIAFFLMLAAAASTVSPVFFVILSIYIVFLIWGMAVLNIRRDMLEAGTSIDASRDLFGLPFFLSLAALSAVCIIITLAVFFVIPRMGVGILERKSAAPLKVSGFSERMEMDSIAEVQLDPAIVMRVEIAGGERPQGPLYFRGASLEFFDGAAWSRRGDLDRILRGDGGLFTLGSPGKRSVEQKVWLEPLDTEALFAASGAYMLRGGFRNLWTDGAGSIRLPSPPFSRLEYTAWSDLSGRTAAPFPDEEYLDASYLQASPEGHKITELAAAASNGMASALGKALAIEDYLRKNHAYTLSPRKGGGKGPLEDFLLHSKEGYCEHFATGMVMMLRSAGIPARVATGFLEGEWNGPGGYFMVRRQDAHSWAEAYIDGGWMRFDPTPPSGPAESPGAAFMYLDLLRLKWNRHVIQFSFSDQRALAHALESRASKLHGLLAGLMPGERPGTGKTLVALIFAFILIAAAFIALKSVRKEKATSGAPPYYIEMLKVLSTRGAPKRPGETPLEFAKRLGETDIAEITDTYLRERYGGEKPGAERMEWMEKALYRLKAASKNRYFS